MGRWGTGLGQIGWREIVTAQEFVSQIKDWLIDSLDTEYAICNRVVLNEV